MPIVVFNSAIVVFKNFWTSGYSLLTTHPTGDQLRMVKGLLMLWRVLVKKYRLPSDIAIPLMGSFRVKRFYQPAFRTTINW